MVEKIRSSVHKWGRIDPTGVKNTDTHFSDMFAENLENYTDVICEPALSIIS